MLSGGFRTEHSRRRLYPLETSDQYLVPHFLLASLRRKFDRSCYGTEETDETTKIRSVAVVVADIEGCLRVWPIPIVWSFLNRHDCHQLDLPAMASASFIVPPSAGQAGSPRSSVPVPTQAALRLYYPKTPGLLSVAGRQGRIAFVCPWAS